MDSSDRDNSTGDSTPIKCGWCQTELDHIGQEHDCPEGEAVSLLLGGALR